MRLEQLTFTRFIAAVAIVIYHYGTHTAVFGNSCIAPVFENAYMGVSYFFLLSGFVMIVASEGKEQIRFKPFMQHRIARIYPLYFFAILLMCFRVGWKAVDMGELLLALSTLQSWVPGKAQVINYAAWSLSVEFFFYLIFPFLYNRIYKKVSFKVIAIGIILVWQLTQVIFYLSIGPHAVLFTGVDKATILFHPLIHLNEFLLGNLAGIYFLNRKSLTGRQSYAMPIILMLALLWICLQFRPGPVHYGGGILSFVLMPLIFLLASDKGWFSRLLKFRWAVFLGEISYGIYILQDTVWSFLPDRLFATYLSINTAEHTTGLFFVRLLVLIGLSALSCFYLEKPLRKMINSL